MATKHTPSPWANNNYRVTAGKQIVADCLFGITQGEEHLQRCKANAHLIAAAPELLETLQKLIAFMEKNGLSKTPDGGFGIFQYEGTEYEEVTKAKQAIEKATAKIA